MAATLMFLGRIARYRHDRETARDLLKAALAAAREADDPRWIAESLLNLGWVALDDDVGQANDLASEALAIYRSIGHQWGICWSLNTLADFAQGNGDFRAALTLSEQALALSQATRDRWNEGHARLGAADATAAQRSAQRAAAHYRESLALLWVQGDMSCSRRALIGLSQVAQLCREFEQAARFLATAEHLSDSDHYVPPYVLAAISTGEAAIRAHIGNRQLAAIRATVQAQLPAQGIAAALGAASSLAATLPLASSLREAFGLTDRQLDVLRLVVEGHSNQEIADALSISEKTVRNHVTNIFTKLDVDSRIAAATLVLRSNLD